MHDLRPILVVSFFVKPTPGSQPKTGANKLIRLKSFNKVYVHVPTFTLTRNNSVACVHHNIEKHSIKYQLKWHYY